MKTKTIILMGVFLLQSLIMAGELNITNNTYQLTGDISSSARRTGRTSNIASKNNKSSSEVFTRFLHSLLVPGLSEYKMGYKKRHWLFGQRKHY